MVPDTLTKNSSVILNRGKSLARARKTEKRPLSEEPPVSLLRLKFRAESLSDLRWVSARRVFSLTNNK